MPFLKKHYEKILLGIVLAGLIGVLVFMLFYIAADNEAMEATRNGLINPPAKPLPELDLSTNAAIMKRVASPMLLDFESGNKIFNPDDWQKTADGQMVRKANLGPQLAVVTNLTPLYLVLTLESVSINELGARYVIGVERQAAPSAARRRKQQRYVSLGDKNDTFELARVDGPPDNPDDLVLKLADTGESAKVTRTQPFRRVDAYMADVRYDPEKKVFHGCRLNSKLTIGGTDYVVVDIGPNGLVLEDQSNQKKTALPFAP